MARATQNRLACINKRHNFYVIHCEKVKHLTLGHAIKKSIYISVGLQNVKAEGKANKLHKCLLIIGYSDAFPLLSVFPPYRANLPPAVKEIASHHVEPLLTIFHQVHHSIYQHIVQTLRAQREHTTAGWQHVDLDIQQQSVQSVQHCSFPLFVFVFCQNENHDYFGTDRTEQG